MNATEDDPNFGSVSFGYNDNVASRVHRPDNCFRITVDDTLERDYFSSYTVEMDAGITPGWGAFIFEDLTCEPMSYEAAAQADVCAMFEEEVGRLETPSAKPRLHVPRDDASAVPTTRTLVANTLEGFQLGFYDRARTESPQTGTSSRRCGTSSTQRRRR